MAVLTLVGMVLTDIAILFHLIGLIAPYWIVHQSSDTTVYREGVWTYCITNNLNTENENTQCVSGDSGSATSGWLYIVRAFVVLGMAALFGAAVANMLNYLGANCKAVLTFLAMKMSFLAALFIFVAFVIYAGASRRKTFHFAFAFEVLSAAVCIGAGVVHLLDMRLGTAVYNCSTAEKDTIQASENTNRTSSQNTVETDPSTSTNPSKRDSGTASV